MAARTPAGSATPSFSMLCFPRFVLSPKDSAVLGFEIDRWVLPTTCQMLDGISSQPKSERHEDLRRDGLVVRKVLAHDVRTRCLRPTASTRPRSLPRDHVLGIDLDLRTGVSCHYYRCHGSYVVQICIYVACSVRKCTGNSIIKHQPFRYRVLILWILGQ